MAAVYEFKTSTASGEYCKIYINDDGTWDYITWPSMPQEKGSSLIDSCKELSAILIKNSLTEIKLKKL